MNCSIVMTSFKSGKFEDIFNHTFSGKAYQFIDGHDSYIMELWGVMGRSVTVGVTTA